MLRKKFKRSRQLGGQEFPVDTSHKRPSRPRPLGSKSKEDAEKLLKQIVVGGDEQLVDKFDKPHTAAHLLKQKKKKTREKTAPEPKWIDEDDDDISLPLPINLKKNPLQREEVTGKEYISELKKKFEKVTGDPDWAKLRWQRDDKIEDEADDEDADVNDLLQSTGDYLATSDRLPSEHIQLKRCSDINKDHKSKVGLKSTEFHPTAQVALTASLDQTLNLFQVDGVKNAKIQSIFLEGFPIDVAHFTADGTEVVMGSRRRYFHYYDMMVGKVAKVSALPALIHNCAKFEVSPDGRFLAFLGQYGYIHLLSAKTKEVICNLKTNDNVSAAAFSSDGQRLYTHGDDGEVYVWNMSTRDCIHRFVDDGCIKGTAIAVSKDGRYLATGSRSGVVNIYDESYLLKPRPTPLKAIMNLTTPCTSLAFNPTNEILAAASSEADRAMKLIHMSSLCVFANFPNEQEFLAQVRRVDFSLNGGYMAIANSRGRAMLYRLKHYTNY